MAGSLIKLKAIEAEALLAELFASQKIDEWVTDSWPAAQVKMGLKQASDFSPKELKPTPPDYILNLRKSLKKYEKQRELSSPLSLTQKKSPKVLPKKAEAKGFGSEPKKEKE